MNPSSIQVFQKNRFDPSFDPKIPKNHASQRIMSDNHQQPSTIQIAVYMDCENYESMRGTMFNSMTNHTVSLPPSAPPDNPVAATRKS